MWTPFKGDPYGILGYACFHNVFDTTNPNSVASKQKNQNRFYEEPDEEDDDSWYEEYSSNDKNIDDEEDNDGYDYEPRWR